LAHIIHNAFGRVTPEETTAREMMMSSIRSQFLSYGQGDIHSRAAEYDSWKTDETTVSEAYNRLGPDQRERLGHSTRNPSFRFTHCHSDGSSTHLWIDANNDLIDRLESGVKVGAANQKQVETKKGDKAF
jgi:hypothetical protein